MLVVIDFDRCIDAQQYFYLTAFTIRTVDDQGDFLLWAQITFEAFQVKGFIAGDAERGDAVIAEELQWQDAHTNQVGTVNALVGACDHRLDAEQLRTFGSPVSRRTCTCLLYTSDAADE